MITATSHAAHGSTKICSATDLVTMCTSMTPPSLCRSTNTFWNGTTKTSCVMTCSGAFMVVTVPAYCRLILRLSPRHCCCSTVANKKIARKLWCMLLSVATNGALHAYLISVPIQYVLPRGIAGRQTIANQQPNQVP